jgi:hypothetical protein
MARVRVAMDSREARRRMVDSGCGMPPVNACEGRVVDPMPGRVHDAAG